MIFSELSFCLEHPGGGPPQGPYPLVCHRFTWRWVLRTISIIDAIGFVDDNVRCSAPRTLRRCIVRVSSIPSLKPFQASG